MRLEDDRISVDRMDHASRDEMAALARSRGQARDNGSAPFYGWAILTVAHADANGRTVQPSPLESNPYHADICLNLPDDTDRRDKQKEHALDLAAHATWEESP